MRGTQSRRLMVQLFSGLLGVLVVVTAAAASPLAWAVAGDPAPRGDRSFLVGSKTWGGCCPRMVTWARFLDHATGVEFYALNTHLEAFDEGPRRRSAALILQRAADRFDPAVPVLVTGDLNEPAAPGQAVYDALVAHGPLVDTWTTAATRSPRYGTFHDYGPLDEDGDRIDWILTTPDVDTRHAHINAHTRGGQYLSDHLPVQAVLQLPAR